MREEAYKTQITRRSVVLEMLLLAGRETVKL